MAKLSLLYINLIGAGIILVMGLILFFALIKPKTEDIATATAAEQSAIQSGGTDQKVQAHKKDLVKAKADTKLINEKWAINQAHYMPEIEFSPVQKSTNMLNLYAFNGLKSDGKFYGVRDLPTVWGLKVLTWYGAHFKDGVIGGAKDGFAIPSMSTDPNAISTMNAITFPPGKPWEVTVVAKTFDDAMLHLRRFNSMHAFGMPVVDNVALEGQSPNLIMTYDLALYVIPPAAPPAPDPIIGAGGGGGAPAGPSGFGGSGGPRPAGGRGGG